MKKCQRFLFLWMLVLGVFAVSAHASGTSGAPAAPETSPMAQIKATTEKILQVLADPDMRGEPNTDKRRTRIISLVDERFNWMEMSRRCLGRYWRKCTEEEKKEFVGLFTELLRRTYMRRVEAYSGEDVQYKGERVDGKYARVSVVVITAQEVEISIVYSMKQASKDWLVYDVSIEGVRLVNNYRNQFGGMMGRMSYEKFIGKLREKVSETDY